jgi:hypothetical protein
MLRVDFGRAIEIRTVQVVNAAKLRLRMSKKTSRRKMGTKRNIVARTKAREED